MAAWPLRLCGILIAAWLAIATAQHTIHGLRICIARRLDVRAAVQRAQTLARAFPYLAPVILSLFTSMLVPARLSQLGTGTAAKLLISFTDMV